MCHVITSRLDRFTSFAMTGLVVGVTRYCPVLARMVSNYAANQCSTKFHPSLRCEKHCGNPVTHYTLSPSLRATTGRAAAQKKQRMCNVINARLGRFTSFAMTGVVVAGSS